MQHGKKAIGQRGDGLCRWVINHYYSTRYQVGKQIGVGSYRIAVCRGRWNGLPLRNSTARALESLLLPLDFASWVALFASLFSLSLSPPGD
jgi:hypothetical protein